jgi:DNA-binding NarL/FixJ family response regulator
VDDHPATCQGIARLLQDYAGIEIVGTASDGLEAVNQAIAQEAQVVVMDIKLPKQNGVKAAHQIRNRRPETGIVALTSSLETRYLHDLLRDGGTGYAYMLKAAPIDTIHFAILTVARGGHYIDPEMARRDRIPAQLESLTPRENDVLQALAEGLSNDGIAQKLSIEPSTVSWHITHIFEKLQVDRQPKVSARVAAALMYLGLIDD